MAAGELYGMRSKVAAVSHDATEADGPSLCAFLRFADA